jgi:hypothetical protein
MIQTPSVPLGRAPGAAFTENKASVNSPCQFIDGLLMDSILEHMEKRHQRFQVFNFQDLFHDLDVVIGIEIGENSASATAKT